MKINTKLELERAEKAAREYETSSSNPYFNTRPQEKHELLVNIILGAHNLMIEESKKKKN